MCFSEEKLFFQFSAKMDATENDVPSPYHVRGFPTIYFAPKNNKNNPKQYEVRFLFRKYSFRKLILFM